MDHTDYIYHRNKTEERMRMIRNSLYGYNTPLSEYVCGEDGVLSDEKIEKLADDLIGLMIAYGDGYEEGISGARRRCLELSIYLLIRAHGGKVKTFGDLLETAEGLLKDHDSLDDLVLWEAAWFRPAVEESDDNDDYDDYDDYDSDEESGEMSYGGELHFWDGRGFFGDLDVSYRMLSGKHIAADLTEEELQKIYEHRQDMYQSGGENIYKKYRNRDYWDDWRESRRSHEQLCLEEEIEIKESIGETEERTRKKLHERFRILTEEERRAASLRRQKEEEEWIASFSEPEKFLEAYKEFRELIFRVGLDCRGLADAVIIFLCKEGRSGLTDNDSFMRLYVQLDKAYRIARNAGKNGK